MKHLSPVSKFYTPSQGPSAFKPTPTPKPWTLPAARVDVSRVPRLFDFVKGKVLGFLVLGCCSLANASAIGDLGKSAVVKTTAKAGAYATGFNIRAPSGGVYTITNNHVCYKNSFLYASRDGEHSRAKISLVASSVRYDLCALTASPGETLALAKAFSWVDTLTVVGHPHGKGTVVSVGHALFWDEDQDNYMHNHPEPCPEGSTRFLADGVPECDVRLEVVVIDANASPGSSGSPVLNERGEVVGVVATAGFDSPLGAGVVPLTHLRNFLERLP